MLHYYEDNSLTLITYYHNNIIITHFYYLYLMGKWNIFHLHSYGYLRDLVPSYEGTKVLFWTRGEVTALGLNSKEQREE